MIRKTHTIAILLIGVILCDPTISNGQEFGLNLFSGVIDEILIDHKYLQSGTMYGGSINISITETLAIGLRYSYSRRKPVSASDLNISYSSYYEVFGDGRINEYGITLKRNNNPIIKKLLHTALIFGISEYRINYNIEYCSETVCLLPNVTKFCGCYSWLDLKESRTGLSFGFELSLQLVDKLLIGLLPEYRMLFGRESRMDYISCAAVITYIYNI